MSSPTIMQVLHQGGGAGSVTSTLHLSLGLARTGWDVRFVCPPDSEVEALARERGLTVRPAGAAAAQPAGERGGACPAHRRGRRGPGQLPERARPHCAHLARHERSARRSVRRDPAADAPDDVPGELDREPDRRARHRRQHGGRRGAGAPGHAEAQAGGDSQRARGGAGGPRRGTGRGRRVARPHRLGARAAHTRHREPAKGPGGRARGAGGGPDAGPPGAGRRGPGRVAGRSRPAGAVEACRGDAALRSRRAPALRAAGAGAAAQPNGGILPGAARGDGAGQAGDRVGGGGQSRSGDRRDGRPPRCPERSCAPGPPPSSGCWPTPPWRAGSVRPGAGRRARPTRSTAPWNAPRSCIATCSVAPLLPRGQIPPRSDRPPGARSGPGVRLHHRSQCDQARLPGGGQHPLHPAGVRRGGGRTSAAPRTRRSSWSAPSGIRRSGSWRPSGT